VNQDRVEKACIVVSLAGRDQGGYFLTLDCNDEYIFMVDGRQRRAERPKKKKRRHVMLAARPEGKTVEKIINGEKVSNSEIRRTLAEYTAAFQGPESGGSLFAKS